MKKVKVGEISLSNKSSLVLISGLNVLEDESIVKEVVGELKKVTEELDIPFIFKASYDKANRSSIESFRGPGIENGLEMLRKIKSDYKITRSRIMTTRTRKKNQNFKRFCRTFYG